MSLLERTTETNGHGAGHGVVGSRRPIVVLAEDNEDTRRVYGLILRHFGYDVADAPTGEEAVAATRKLHPDLVLMDIGLPGMDGWQASRLLKADPETHGIPLVAFSARVNSTDDLAGQSDTFDGFILKPISPTGLVKRVDAYLRLRRDTTDGFESKTVFVDDYANPPAISEQVKSG